MDRMLVRTQGLINGNVLIYASPKQHRRLNTYIAYEIRG